MAAHGTLPAIPQTGLILTGGGARAAYQVGALKAIADILPAQYPNPFPIICGTSAGGLNAAALATHAGSFKEGVNFLQNVWGNFHSDQVYRTDWAGVLNSAFKWMMTFCFGRLKQDMPVSLLDNRPLRTLLENLLELERIQTAIDRGDLRALCITASGYSSGESVSFFQGAPDLISWRRSRRVGVRTPITIDHLLASSSIPLLFQAVKVNREYFGDGAIRQLAPISPALHLGAEKILVIGVGTQTQIRLPRHPPMTYPSIANIVSHVMNSSFVDALETDIERLSRINRTVSLVPADIRAQHLQLREVDFLVLTPPSEVLDKIAMKHADRLPNSIRFFVNGSGATKSSGSAVLSYLLFEAEYCQDLMDLGYQDTLARRREIERFFCVSDQKPNIQPDNVVPFKRAEYD